MPTVTILISFGLHCLSARYVGMGPSPFKAPGCFEIAFPISLAWRAHIATAQLTIPAPRSQGAPAWNTPEVVGLLGL